MEQVTTYISGSGGGGGCFRKGTLVQLEGGKSVPIEELSIGDEILSFKESGEIELAKVERIHHHIDPQPILKVSFWRGEVFITPNHWVLNQYGSFVEMGNLTCEDALVDGMGHLRPITGIQLVAHEPVWNLTVSPNHTFIANNIRVHNGGHRERFPVIGSGGGGGGKGGGGGSPRVPVEAEDTLQSMAKVAAVDLLGEGQIGGLVNGARSIFVNDVPLENADGSKNFIDYNWQFRNGTQDQQPMTGFADISTPFNVGAALKANIPYSFSVSNSNIDSVRVIVSVGALFEVDPTTGDTSGSTVAYKIRLSKDGGPFSDVDSIAINGKTRSTFQKASIVQLPKPGNSWVIQVVRTTPDSTSANKVNPITLASYVEVIDSRLSYPNSAISGVNINAEQFSSIPRRSYLVDGLMIKVPSNYDHVTRQYTGLWNGTFKLASSNNPAWILYDLLTNTRYGLGQFFNTTQIDKSFLYVIGKYCDEMVPNGYGGNEPRFTINTVIQSQAEAYKVVTDICAVFRGVAYWSGNTIGFSFDAPSDPVMAFGQSNVIDGLFSYSGSSRKDRHSVVHVTWNDPDEGYKQKIEYVEDQELVKKLGVRRADVVAFGCTSRAQANRMGRWILYSEKYESDLITFKAGMDASLLRPGDIIKVNDQYRSGKRMSGRITAISLSSVSIDAPITLASGTVLISLRMADGSFVEKQASATGSPQSSFVFFSPFTAGQSLPVLNSIFLITEPTLQAQQYRVSQVSEDKTGTYSIAAIENNPSKYSAIDYNLQLEVQSVSKIAPLVSVQPSNLFIYRTTYLAAPGVIGLKVHISWTGTQSTYELSWRVANSGWVTTLTKSPSAVIEGAQLGVYDFSVVGINTFGVRSEPVVAVFEVTNDTTPPSPCQNLIADGAFRSINISWINPPDLDLDYVEIFQSSLPDIGTATKIAQTQSNFATIGGLGGAVTRYFWVRGVDTSGNVGAFNSSLGTSATTFQVSSQDLVDQFVSESKLTPALLARIEGSELSAETLASFYQKVEANVVKVNNIEYQIKEFETFKTQVQSPDSYYLKSGFTQGLEATIKDQVAAQINSDLQNGLSGVGAAIQNNVQQAVITNLNETTLGPSGPVAQQINSLNSKVETNKELLDGTILELSEKSADISVIQSSVNGLEAQFTVKIDNNGYVSGFGLSSTPVNGVPTSEFVVLADRFAIALPGAAGPSFPFIVTTVNGQPRVSINTAFIQELIAVRLSSVDEKFIIDFGNKYISIEA